MKGWLVMRWTDRIHNIINSLVVVDLTVIAAYVIAVGVNASATVTDSILFVGVPVAAVMLILMVVDFVSEVFF